MASGFRIGQRDSREMAFSALSASTRFSYPGAPIHDFSFHAVMPTLRMPSPDMTVGGAQARRTGICQPPHTPCARVKGTENMVGFCKVLLTQCGVLGCQPQKGGLMVWKQRSGFGEVTECQELKGSVP